MKKILLVLFVINLVLLFNCNKPVEQTSDQKEIISNVIKDFYQKLDMKDIPGLMTFFRDDFQWYSVNGMMLTKEKFESFFTPIFNNWEFISTDINIFDIHIEGNMAVARFGTKMQIDKNNKPIINLHTMVLLYQFGEWKMWHHQESMQ